MEESEEKVTLVLGRGRTAKNVKRDIEALRQGKGLKSAGDVVQFLLEYWKSRCVCEDL